MRVIYPKKQKKNNMLSVTKTSKYWFLISGVLIVLSAIALIFWGLKPGIDFIGGSIMEIQGKGVTVVTVRQSLEKAGQSDTEIQNTANNSVQIRLRLLSPDDHTKLLESLKKDLKNLDELRFDTVGPTFSRDLLNKSVTAIVLACVAILVYLAFVFRKSGSVVSSWAFGSFAVLALVHDVIVICGFFAIYAHFFGASADSLFITAILTVIGFSVHDTIVIFNRIKSNLRLYRMPFSDLVDQSVIETFTRSINTTVTTFLVLLALLYFGGSTTRAFVATLCAGMIVGSYSSMFVAAPLLVLWQGRKAKTKR